MLPIFLLGVFTIMEIGHLAFRTILLHHAAYEVARIGSLTAYPVSVTSCMGPRVRTSEMRQTLKRILPRARMSVRGPRPTLSDPQDHCQNWDLVVVVTDDVPMIFPMTGLILGNARGRQARRVQAAVPMPIERPLWTGA